MTILKAAIATDSRLPAIVAERVANQGFRKVGILGLSYKGDLKVHVLSPTIRMSKRLKEVGVEVEVNDPYYSDDEITRLTACSSFKFPDDLSEFDCVLVVAGHRLYRAVSEKRLFEHLKNCRLVIDNLEETWRSFDWLSAGISYHVAGDSHWLTSEHIDRGTK